MELTVEMAAVHIATDKFDAYMKEFTDLGGFFIALKKKPNCDGCMQKAMLELSRQPDLENRLKKIYGDDLEVHKDLLMYKARATPNIASSTTEVYFVLKDDYKAFIEEFTQDKIVRAIDTVYIPEDKEICLTIVYNAILKQE